MSVLSLLSRPHQVHYNNVSVFSPLKALCRYCKVLVSRVNHE